MLLMPLHCVYTHAEKRSNLQDTISVVYFSTKLSCYNQVFTLILKSILQSIRISVLNLSENS